jgi:hypothetical protein
MSTDVGGTYRSSLSVYDDTGALATPATKTCTVTKPDQTTASASVVVDSAGKLHADYVIAVEGLHKFVWSTASPTTSKTDYENGTVYRSIVGLGEMRSYLHLKDTTGDEILRDYLAAATELAERIIGTCIPRLITDEHITGQNKYAIRLPQAPIMPDTDITVASQWPSGPSWDQDTLLVDYEGGNLEPLNWIGFWYGPWKATYTAGRLVIPRNAILAVKETVADLWSSQRGRLDDPLVPTMQQELEFEARVPPGYEMPPQAKARLKRMAQPGFA